MIVIFGIIAAIAGSVLIGYSLGRRAVERKRIAKDLRIFALEAAQSVDRSVGPAADQGNVPLTEPATDHERAIAEAVDEKFQENPGNRQPTIRDYLDISASINFVMSAEDSQFLVDYLRWRLTHPISRSKSKGASA
jgi:type II secretory pathway pseudopilin PulG